MRRPLKHIIIFFSLLLSILYTTLAFSYANPQSWVGSSIQAVIEDWGTPDVNFTQANGSRVLVYRIKTYQQPNQSYAGSVGVNAGGGRPVVVVSSPYSSGPMDSSLALVCQIEFRANAKGVIIGAKTSGTGCSAH